MAIDNITRTCSIEGCPDKVKTRQMCNKHYLRAHKHGDPHMVKKRWDWIHEDLPKWFWSRIAITGDEDECWEWQHGCNAAGYGILNVQYHPKLAHRFAWTLVNGREPVLDILHSCDNPPCCNPKHLREGTHGDNQRDAEERGRWKPIRGEQHGRTFFVEAEIRQIKQWIADGLKPKEIMTREPRLNKGFISKLRHNQRWKHVTL